MNDQTSGTPDVNVLDREEQREREQRDRDRREGQRQESDEEREEREEREQQEDKKKQKELSGLEKQVEQEFRKLPPEIKKELKKPKGLIAEALADAIFGGWVKEKYPQWERDRETYMNRFFRDLAFITNIVSWGFFQSNLGRGAEGDLIRIRAYRRWINEKIKEYREIEINADTRRDFYFHHALSVHQDKEAWAWATSLATTADLNETDIEKLYEHLAKREQVVVQYDVPDPQTGEKIKMTKPLEGVYHYPGDKILLGVEISARRVGVSMGRRIDNWHGGIRKPLLHPKTGEIIGVAIKTLDEWLKNADDDASMAAGRRAESPVEFDFYNRYDTAEEVEAAVMFLKDQIERLEGWSQTESLDEEGKQRLQIEIRHCQKEIQSLSVDPKTGQTDYGVGAGRVKSFMIDFSNYKPKWLMAKQGMEHEHRFINLDKVKVGDNDYSVFQVAMSPTYLKWLAGFRHPIIRQQEHIRVSATFNWEDLFSEDRQEAFKARLRHNEYGGRTPKGETDRRVEVLIKGLENMRFPYGAGVEERAQAAEEAAYQKFSQGYNAVIDEKDARGTRVGIGLEAERQRISQIANEQVNQVISRLQRLFSGARRLDLAQELGENPEDYLKKLWGLPGEKQAGLAEQILESLTAYGAEEFEILKDQYTQAQEVQEVIAKEFPFIEDLLKARELLDKGIYRQVNISGNFRPRHQAYQAAFRGIGDVDQGKKEQVIAFINQHQDILDYDRQKLIHVEKQLDGKIRKPEDIYHEVRLDLKALQIQLRREIQEREEDKLRDEFADLLSVDVPDQPLVNLHDRETVMTILKKHSVDLRNEAFAQVDNQLDRESQTIETIGLPEYEERIDKQKNLLIEQQVAKYLDKFEDSLLKILEEKIEQPRQGGEERRAR